jgi:O-antigen ligase
VKYVQLGLSISTWLSAVLLATLPIVVAADFGGVLWWTQYAAAQVAVLAAVLAVPAIFAISSTSVVRQHVFVLIMLAWSAYAWLQTVPIFSGLASTLSRGSRLAYRDWIEPFMGSEGAPTFYPISIDVEQSAHAVAVLAIVTCLVWASTQVFVTRGKISMLLNVMAVGAALHAAFGIIRQVYPDVQVFGIEMNRNSFGSFVNRNNAALMLNLGFGASVGLLAWRLAAMTGLELDDRNFEFNDLFALMNDRDSLIGFFSAVLSFCGLLICGSRGGLVALVIGGLLALGWVRSKRGTKTIPVVAAAIAISAAVLLIPLKLDLESIQRFELFERHENSTSLLDDARLMHWQSSMRAAKAHFPAGSGLGTYAFAYLPYQGEESDAWYHHADNLWLEMLVEQGLPGLVMVLAILFLFTRTLLRMTHSVDPIDHGLRVAGWYILGAVATSQFFDFGLIIPGSLFLVAVYIPATMARATAAGLNAVEGQRELFPPKYARYFTFTVAAFVLLFGFLALGRLRGDAELEQLTKYIAATLPRATRDQDKLATLENEIRQSPRLDQSPTLQNQLANVQYAQIRIAETVAANPDSEAAAQAAYDRSDVIAHRRQWYASRVQPAAEDEDTTKSPDDSANDPATPDFKSAERADKTEPPDSAAGDEAASGDQAPTPDAGSAAASNPLQPAYQSILDASEKSLRLLPLGMEARSWQLYFDFVHQDQARSEQAIDQLAKIFQGNSLMLERLAYHAATAGDYQRATRLWRRSLESDPRRAVAMLEQIQATKNVKLLDVLPSSPTVFRKITRKLLDTGNASPELLTRASQEIKCDECESNREKSECLQLASDIAKQQGDADAAIALLLSAIELVPTQIQLHLDYTQLLRDNDRRRDALTAARRARILFPEDPRFDRMIRDMAEEDLEGLEGIPDNPLLPSAATEE